MSSRNHVFTTNYDRVWCERLQNLLEELSKQRLCKHMRYLLLVSGFISLLQEAQQESDNIGIHEVL